MLYMNVTKRKLWSCISCNAGFKRLKCLLLADCLAAGVN